MSSRNFGAGAARRAFSRNDAVEINFTKLLWGEIAVGTRSTASLTCLGVEVCKAIEQNTRKQEWDALERVPPTGEAGRAYGKTKPAAWFRLRESAGDAAPDGALEIRIAALLQRWRAYGAGRGWLLRCGTFSQGCHPGLGCISPAGRRLECD